MGHEPEQYADSPVLFAREMADPLSLPAAQNGVWKVLVVDDEPAVHEITRITLKNFILEDRSLEVLSAFSGHEARKVLTQESDIAMVLLDVVMEADDTGLELVRYIRQTLGNTAVRIVLRTGQPGKAPEQQIISQYDINDYKTKPEFTAQKLFTSVTACLRAYQNLKTIERNRKGLESIIRSSSSVFKNTSFRTFGHRVLTHLEKVLDLADSGEIRSAYFIGFPAGKVLVMASAGGLEVSEGAPVEQVLSGAALENYHRLFEAGGETFIGREYLGVFRSKEGFVSVFYLEKTDFLSPEEQYLIRIYANNISIGFDNISLAREIINTQKEVILILGEVVETRSQETANHVTRVAEVCYFLARHYGLDDDSAELLRLAAPMHDVGKIGIPEAILNKPGKLTSQEFERIKSHARIGYEILSKSSRPIMTAAAVTALEHHERWDGKGYPRKLSGTDIHIFGRIAAVADVFDALAHKRCYKEAWPMDRVISLFKQERGLHFDPDLIDIFLDHIDDFIAINSRFPE
jgi:response regulator RpfG family c-di-GMP phosphodiesterase